MFDPFTLVVAFSALLALGVIFLAAFLVYLAVPMPTTGRLESETLYEDPQEHGKRCPFPTLEDPAAIDLSVIVPAYNEEERLPAMMEDALEYLEHRRSTQPKFTYEIIVVDDGSKDKTTQVALAYSKKHSTQRVRVLTLAKNRGKGGAVRLGMLSGRGKLLLFADGDGATKFADVSKLEAEVKKLTTKDEDMAVVCGSRAHLEQDSIATRSVFRTLLMVGFHLLVRSLCVRGVKDTQCGFKLFTRAAARLLFYNLHVERWAFDVDLLHIAERFNIPIAEVAVTWTEIEGSKLSPFWASVQMGRDLFLIRLRYLLGIWKMEAKPKAM